jgi:hypothetical protein
MIKRYSKKATRRASLFCLLIGMLIGLSAFAADTTRPTKPNVSDDGAYTSSPTSLHASWKSSDAQSGIAEYQFAIRQNSTSGAILVNWTSVGLAREITRTDLNLLHGNIYFIGVRAKNGAGLWSLDGYSNGIKVDTTPPAAPGLPTEGSSTSDYDYDPDGQYTIYWPSAADSESGIDRYELQEQVIGSGTWMTIATTASRSHPVSGRRHNGRYFYRVRAKNRAELWSPWSQASDGLLVDKTVPLAPTVTDDGATTFSATQLHATWVASDWESGIAEYQYMILQDSTSGIIVANWTSVGTAADATRAGMSLVNGKTYFIGVRAKNGAGVWSPTGYSDGITVNGNPPPSPAAYQGFGAETFGGEGQAVYRVTNLNDSGPGSLRDAVSKSHRSVVFDVTGEILLASQVYVRGAFVTIDGFTAPSPGITLKNHGLYIYGSNGAHDVIVRNIRVRDSLGDGININTGAYNIVIDHVSIKGSADGNIDITNNSHNVTVSWSILAEPIESHSMNMLIKYNSSRITLHHNMLIRARERNPQVRVDDAGTSATDTTVDLRNNLVWDWGPGSGTLVWFGPWTNIVNNFYSNPSGSTNDRNQAIIVCQGECSGGNPSSAAQAYAHGNYSADGINLDGKWIETTPFLAPPVDITDAIAACEQVLAHAGAKPIDALDQQYRSLVSCH